MNRVRKGSAVLIVLLVIIILAVVGGLWYYETHKTSLDIPFAGGDMAPALVNTYHDAKYQISFASPADWYVANQPNGEISTGWPGINPDAYFYIMPNDTASPYRTGYYLAMDCEPAQTDGSFVQTVSSDSIMVDGASGTITTLRVESPQPVGGAVEELTLDVREQSVSSSAMCGISFGGDNKTSFMPLFKNIIATIHFDNGFSLFVSNLEKLSPAVVESVPH